jgi:hypothetical protein
MTDYRLEESLAAEIGLARRPVAIAFLDAPPAGVGKFEGAEPLSCSFWRLAAEGRTFYTVPSDRWNCPIGSCTHNAPLPPERAPEEDSGRFPAARDAESAAHRGSVRRPHRQSRLHRHRRRRMYVVAPGRDLERPAEEVETITSANAALADYHRLRQAVAS